MHNKDMRIDVSSFNGPKFASKFFPLPPYSGEGGFEAGLHVRRKHKPRVNRDDASTNAGAVWSSFQAKVLLLPLKPGQDL